MINGDEVENLFLLLHTSYFHNTRSLTKTTFSTYGLDEQVDRAWGSKDVMLDFGELRFSPMAILTAAANLPGRSCPSPKLTESQPRGGDGFRGGALSCCRS